MVLGRIPKVLHQKMYRLYRKDVFCLTYTFCWHTTRLVSDLVFAFDPSINVYSCPAEAGYILPLQTV